MSRKLFHCQDGLGINYGEWSLAFTLESFDYALASVVFVGSGAVLGSHKFLFARDGPCALFRVLDVAG